MKRIACSVLLFHGSKLSATTEEAEHFLQTVTGECRNENIQIAFLTKGTPSLIEALEIVVRKGFHEIRIFPMLLLAGVHITNDIPNMLTPYMKDHPNIAITLMDHLTKDPSFASWLAHKIDSTN